MGGWIHPEQAPTARIEGGRPRPGAGSRCRDLAINLPGAATAYSQRKQRWRCPILHCVVRPFSTGPTLSYVLPGRCLSNSKPAYLRDTAKLLCILARSTRRIGLARLPYLPTALHLPNSSRAPTCQCTIYPWNSIILKMLRQKTIAIYFN